MHGAGTIGSSRTDWGCRDGSHKMPVGTRWRSRSPMFLAHRARQPPESAQRVGNAQRKTIGKTKAGRPSRRRRFLEKIRRPDAGQDLATLDSPRTSKIHTYARMTQETKKPVVPTQVQDPATSSPPRTSKILTCARMTKRNPWSNQLHGSMLKSRWPRPSQHRHERRRSDTIHLLARVLVSIRS